MGLLEQQNFMARIFTDESLRQSFWENPEKIGQANGLSEIEIAQFKEIIPENLNFFAESLFHKRLHEVEKLLPLTKRVLGDEFSKIFQKFAKKFQPTTVKKHLEDAIEFCQHLQSLQLAPIGAKDTAKFEQTRHKFFSQNKYLAFCILRYDVFNLKKKLGLAVWYRIGNQSHHFIL